MNAAGRRPPIDATKLRPDELRVLEAASHGLTGVEIAELLDVDHDTVLGHLLRARRLLAAKTTTHAVAEALRAELIR